MAENLRALSSDEVFEDHLRLARSISSRRTASATSRPTASSWSAGASSVDTTGCTSSPDCWPKSFRTRPIPTPTDWLRVGSRSWNGQPKPITLAYATELTRSSLRMAGSSRRPSTTPSSRRDRPAYRTRRPRAGRRPPSPLAQVVILAVIPQATANPNQTALNRNATQPDLARPNWTVETRRLAVSS
jgi:hypothetical protein